MKSTLLLAALAAAPLFSQASIKMNDGSTITGEIQGTVLFADKDRPSYSIVSGKGIRSLGKAGNKLDAEAVVVDAGLPLATSPDVYRAAKAVDLLKVVMPAAEKIEPVKAIASNIGLSAIISGETEGPGTASVDVPGAKVYIMKRFRDTPSNYPIAGEISKSGENYRLVPQIRVLTASGTVTLDVTKIEPPEEKP